MKIQNFLYSRRCSTPYCCKTNTVKSSNVRCNYEMKDCFVPSFGLNSAKIKPNKLKALVIPKEMFATKEEAANFSRIVEAIRTISDNNCKGRKYKEIAQMLFNEDDSLNLYSQALEFICKNDPKIKVKTPQEFDKWETRKFLLLQQSLKDNKNKVIAEAYDYFENNCDNLPLEDYLY